MAGFTFPELADMHLLNWEILCNSHAAMRLYAERFPTVCTVQRQDAVQQLFQQNAHTSTHSVPGRLNTTHTTVLYVLHQERMHPFKSPRDFPLRLRFVHLASEHELIMSSQRVTTICLGRTFDWTDYVVGGHYHVFVGLRHVLLQLPDNVPLAVRQQLWAQHDGVPPYYDLNRPEGLYMTDVDLLLGKSMANTNRKIKETTSYQINEFERGRIVGLREASWTLRCIARQWNNSAYTVSRGEGSSRSLRKPSDQRNRLARFPHARIRERPYQELDPNRLGTHTRCESSGQHGPSYDRHKHSRGVSVYHTGISGLISLRKQASLASKIPRPLTHREGLRPDWSSNSSSGKHGVFGGSVDLTVARCPLGKHPTSITPLASMIRLQKTSCRKALFDPSERFGTFASQGKGSGVHTGFYRYRVSQINTSDPGQGPEPTVSHHSSVNHLVRHITPRLLTTARLTPHQTNYPPPTSHLYQHNMHHNQHHNWHHMHHSQHPMHNNQCHNQNHIHPKQHNFADWGAVLILVHGVLIVVNVMLIVVQVVVLIVVHMVIEVRIEVLTVVHVVLIVSKSFRARGHDRIACVKRFFRAMKHYSNGHMQFMQDDILKNYTKHCKESSFESKKKKSIPRTASMGDYIPQYELPPRVASSAAKCLEVRSLADSEELMSIMSVSHKH
ncbi:hypothetical protein PR048_027732 [Dryococelus australis]|uniref:Uncharacterized protein n=1 Tax=Dryococelus australis TaxID=614101 RepID=A0ABQ9GHC8_9NEOP|nr:hypothetical protein PR048_027732 [Dryococelus australis]